MIESHVTTLDLSRRLAEAGVPQDACWCWVNFNDSGEDNWELMLTKDYGEVDWEREYEHFSAFMATELMPFLPNGYVLKKAAAYTCKREEWPDVGVDIFIASTGPEAIGQMIRYLTLTNRLSFLKPA